MSTSNSRLCERVEGLKRGTVIDSIFWNRKELCISLPTQHANQTWLSDLNDVFLSSVPYHGHSWTMAYCLAIYLGKASSFLPVQPIWRSADGFISTCSPQNPDLQSWGNLAVVGANAPGVARVKVPAQQKPEKADDDDASTSAAESTMAETTTQASPRAGFWSFCLRGSRACDQQRVFLRSSDT